MINAYSIVIWRLNQKKEVDSSVKKFKLSYKHISLVFLIIGGVLLAWTLISMIYNPMRRPAPMIRNHILRQTPVGTCIEEVIEVIESNERWGIPTVNRRSGFIHPSPWDYDARFGELIVGTQSVQTRPEIYNVILFHERRTRIFWGFDENGKLIEVYVSSVFAPRLL